LLEICSRLYFPILLFHHLKYYRLYLFKFIFFLSYYNHFDILLILHFNLHLYAKSTQTIWVIYRVEKIYILCCIFHRNELIIWFYQYMTTTEFFRSLLFFFLLFVCVCVCHDADGWQSLLSQKAFAITSIHSQFFCTRL
jgi:hypothetical protein